MTGGMLFLAWAPPSHSGRSRHLSRRLGIPLLEMSLFRPRSPRPLTAAKYGLQTVLTWAALLRQRPRVVFVQNPPIPAALAVWVFGLILGTRLVIDSHTDALTARFWRFALPLHRFLSRRAVCTLVTNDFLKALVESWGARAFVLAEIPAELPCREMKLEKGWNVVMVGSFSYDEPRREVFAAARRLPDVRIHITGPLELADSTELASAPSNVRFTGFLPFQDYCGLLAAAQAVMVLTTENHTFQMGACEAFSLGKPVITSDWPFLRSVFPKGVIFVENSSEGIYRGLLRMREESGRLAREVSELQGERRARFEAKTGELLAILRKATGRE